jgi:hypothetical protein
MEEAIQTKNIIINNDFKATYKHVGTTYLLNQIAIKTCVYDDLMILIPYYYLQILSLAYFLTIENYNPRYQYPILARDHDLPYENDISSQCISELLTFIDENIKIALFKKQLLRRIENEYFVYDITSISSYSENILLAKYGHNIDGYDL